MFAGIAIGAQGIQHFDFVPSRGRLDDLSLFDCATAAPTRLVLEVGRRLLKLCPTAQVLVIGNPILSTKAVHLAQWAAAASGCPAVINDSESFPLGYIIPSSIFHEGMERFLVLLSGIAASVDATLLEYLTGKPVVRVTAPIPAVEIPTKLSTNGTLLGTPFSWSWGMQSIRAVELMRLRPDWRQLPFATYHPYHAGDVLFFSLAERLCRTPIYQEQIVCKSYGDIWRAGGSQLRQIETTLAPPPRDNSISDGQHFLDTLNELGPEVTEGRFIAFSRYSRYYNLSPFHLIDHARFSLGESLDRIEDLYFFTDVPLRRCELPRQPLRVLLAPSGGWPLKGYRPDELAVIVRLLVACGMQVTVLDQPSVELGELVEACGGRLVSAPDIAALKPLIESHHVFVAADSLPHHYAACVLGHPTIGLFASTAPWNSCGPHVPHYRFLTGDLPCSPCGGEQVCQLTKGEHCHNQPSAEQIAATVLDFAEQIYGS